MPQSVPPVSRTVVKPRSSISFMRLAPRAAARVSGTSSMRRRYTSLCMQWTWQSIRPGSTTRPPQSITSASDVMGRSLTSWMRSPSISTS